LATLTGHREGVTDVAFSADGSLLASSSWDVTMRLWQVSDGRMLRSIEPSATVLSLAFSPDGSLLASAGEDGTVQFWGVSEAISLASQLQQP